MASKPGIPRSSLLPALLTVLAAAPLAPTAAHAPFPGANGKIAFDRFDQTRGLYDIYTMNPDGSDPSSLLNDASGDVSPAWSSDGQRIAFTQGADLQIANANGTGKVNLTPGDGTIAAPSWAPDETKLLFQRQDPADFCQNEIWVINADGGGQSRLTSSSAFDDQAAAWSPDGQKIAFVRRSSPSTVRSASSGRLRST